ncbi:MAG: LysE family translocator [Cyanobacteria bacterium J06628_6]
MTFWAGWLTVFAVGLVAVVTPGPDFALTLRSALAYSRRAGVFTAVGIGLGNTVHATYSLVGIGALISQSILLFNALKLLGAAYLIYLGIKSLGAKPVQAQQTQRQSRLSMPGLPSVLVCWGICSIQRRRCSSSRCLLRLCSPVRHSGLRQSMAAR